MDHKEKSMNNLATRKKTHNPSKRNKLAPIEEILPFFREENEEYTKNTESYGKKIENQQEIQ